EMMRRCGTPSGLSAVGYGRDDVAKLARGAFAQKRLVDNAPRAVDEAALATLFTDAMGYW
ncbi:MAG TPA: alcohol dehydrogenase, partial [Polyangia bacterium]